MEAAKKMLDQNISGLPVVDDAGQLVGIISEGDLLRRPEIGTQRRRARWLHFLTGPGKSAADFVHEHGRKVREVMSREPFTVSEDASLDQIVDVMEKNNIKRLPVMHAGRVVGIVTRSNLVRALAALAREVPDPTADDDHIRMRIVRQIEQNDWRPLSLQVTVRNGAVHLYGVITDYRSRDAAIVAAENVAGVGSVHDHLCWIEPYSGAYLLSEEDEAAARGDSTTAA
jgi:CBS domain-containing protein